MPFVFLTALTDRDNELKGRQLGADDYVTKPIDFEVLTVIISARLAGVARSELWPKLVQLNDRELETLTLWHAAKHRPKSRKFSGSPSGPSIFTSTTGAPS
jgi:DNA-binding response OmpR family regulator